MANMLDNFTAKAGTRLDIECPFLAKPAIVHTALNARSWQDS
jgi:hypothetical protein